MEESLAKEKKKSSMDQFHSSRALSEKYRHFLNGLKKNLHFLQLQDSHSSMIPTI